MILRSGDDVLAESPGIVRRVLQKLSVEEPATKSLPGRLRIALPSTGTIDVLTQDLQVDNSYMPDPAKSPNSDEKQRSDRLLDAIRESLGDDAADNRLRERP
jgi:hypothetical protein